MSDHSLLQRVPLFCGALARRARADRRVAVPRSFPKGVRVFHEGDSSDACYIVRSGDLRVTREHSDGRAIALATLGRGDIFGELAMLDGGPARRASRRSATPSCWRCPPPTCARSLAGQRRHHREARRRAHPAAARDQRADRRQSFQTVPSRVAGVLSQLIAEEAIRRGARRGHDPDDPGRPRAARRHLARERQPLPRHARARRRRPRRARPGHRARAAAAARLHLLTAGLRPLDSLRPAAGADGRAPAAPARDHRRAGARGDGGRPARALRPRAPSSAAPTTTRRCRSADGQTISQPWIVAAIARRWAVAATSACSRSAPARATRPPCWRGSRAR